MTHDEREPRDTPPEDQPQAQPADRRTDADGATPDETFADRPSGGPPPSEVEAYAAPPSVHTEPAMPAHSVPATEPGESTRCPRCGTENRPGISFCRSCGQRLVAAGTPTTVERPAAPEGTQQCPRCGTHNRAGVAFCQNCGANLRAAPPPEPGYVPPPVATGGAEAAPAEEAAPGRAVLGPVVLLIGAVGLVTAWLLPFAVTGGSLYDAAFGPGGYGVGFWSELGAIGAVADQVYFVLAAASPILVLLLVVLVLAGFARAAPGGLQRIGLVVAILWALGLVALFVVVELLGGLGGDLLDLLRNLSPGGIIFFLASLIVLIGGLTRLGRA